MVKKLQQKVNSQSSNYSNPCIVTTNQETKKNRIPVFANKGLIPCTVLSKFENNLLPTWFTKQNKKQLNTKLKSSPFLWDHLASKLLIYAGFST